MASAKQKLTQGLEDAFTTMKQSVESIQLPWRYRPRKYQAALLNAFFDMLEGKNEIENFLLCWHRRAGKDVSFFQCVVAAAKMEIGDYYYLMPKQNQARRVLWNGIVSDSDGLPCKFNEFIPPSLVKTMDSVSMRIEMTNGSNIYIGGSDNYNNFVGGNAKGIVYSEWSLCNPLARDYFKPMINQNNGWQMFCFTPRGKNHAHKTLLAAQKDANKGRWFVDMRDVTQTAKEDGTPVITDKQIESDIADGMDEDTAKQEYYLDFNAAVKGVIYGKEMERLRKEGRVYKFPVDKTIPILTFWDIGISKGNATAVWLMQPCPDTDRLRCVGYTEDEQEGVEHYLNWLKEFCMTHNAKLGKIYFPHDGKNTEWVSGKKRHEQIIALGYDVIVLPRISDVWIGITQTRKLFERLEFHEEFCGVGLNHLENYKRRINAETGMQGTPIHDESSNGADALRMMGQYYADKYTDERHDKEKHARAKETLERMRKEYNPLANTGSKGNQYNPFKN